MIDLGLHSASVRTLLPKLHLPLGRVLAILVPYYLLTMVSALLEGVGMVVLVGLFTGGALPSGLAGGIPGALHSLGLLTTFPDAVPFLIGLFGINLLLRVGLLATDSAIAAVLRQKTQEAVFGSYLHGDWAHLRGFRVGDAVGTTTQEAVVVAKYLSSVVSTGYFVFGAIVMSGLAVITSPQIALAFGITALPLAWLLQRSFARQADYSKRAAALRNEFSADITDRLNGLLQIHVDGDYDFHQRESLRTQSRLTRLDMLTGFYSAMIGSVSLMMPLAGLIGYTAWSWVAGPSVAPNLSLVASVGILGLRIAAQLTGAVAAVGNLSRLSGSLFPVLNALNTPQVRERQAVKEPISRVQLLDVSYAYTDQPAVSGFSMLIERGAPVVLSGRSGKGKTTLANLIAGLYFPHQGEVTYIGASGKIMPSTSYRANVGYVTQDIYLFRGTLRSNLTSGRSRSDEEIWSVLEQVDAAAFVRDMGGLDTESTEAGRSLSGGQRRRLGIARVLLSGSEIIILDEVTSGLDSINRAAVLRVIERLSEKYVVVVVSHEPLSLATHNVVVV